MRATLIMREACVYNVTIIFCNSLRKLYSALTAKSIKDPKEFEYGKSQILAWH